MGVCRSNGPLKTVCVVGGFGPTYWKVPLSDRGELNRHFPEYLLGRPPVGVTPGEQSNYLHTQH